MLPMAVRDAVSPAMTRLMSDVTQRLVDAARFAAIARRAMFELQTRGSASAIRPMLRRCRASARRADARAGAMRPARACQR